MITDNNKKLAQWAMDFALKNGCQAAKVVLYGMGINVYVDGRYGNYSTNRLDKKELETFIKNGIESTRYLAPDEFRVLADPARYYTGGKPDLQMFDDKIFGINPDDKVALARAAAGEVMGKNDRII